LNHDLLLDEFVAFLQNGVAVFAHWSRHDLIRIAPFFESKEYGPDQVVDDVDCFIVRSGAVDLIKPRPASLLLNQPPKPAAAAKPSVAASSTAVTLRDEKTAAAEAEAGYVTPWIVAHLPKFSFYGDSTASKPKLAQTFFSRG